MNLLIPYVHLYDHNDPLFKEFTYGDVSTRARKLKANLEEGDYVFFHTKIGGKKHITAYYVIDRVMDTVEAIKNKKIISKYKNPHILEFLSGERKDDHDDVMIFGDPITSRILDRPISFDRSLVEKLSLNIRFRKDMTETQAIGSATRSWRKLNDKDVDILLEAIKLSERVGFKIETVLSTDEVTEVIEKDIENFIEKNTSLIGDSLKLVRKQLGTPVGRIDLLFEDKNSNPIIVELKLHKIGRDAINQIRRYMKWIEKQTDKEAKGVIVCKGVMPAFREDLKKLKNVRIFFYGWKLKVYLWENNHDM
ncbi:MAG: endonuclease NucS domain-containing protein [Petrotogales bacterium]